MRKTIRRNRSNSSKSESGDRRPKSLKGKRIYGIEIFDRAAIDEETKIMHVLEFKRTTDQ